MSKRDYGATAKGGILGRRKPRAVPLQGGTQNPRISADFNGVDFSKPGATRAKRHSHVQQYPERRCPSNHGPARDRWIRELVGSIVTRAAPILLDRHDAILALDLTPTTFDRRIADGSLELENMAVVGNRELYQRTQIRDLLLSPSVSKPRVSAGLNEGDFQEPTKIEGRTPEDGLSVPDIALGAPE